MIRAGLTVLTILVLVLTTNLSSVRSYADADAMDEERYCASSNFELTEPIIKDLRDNLVENARSGSPVVVEVSVASNCQFHDYPVLILFEVRDDSDSSKFIAYQNFTIDSEDSRAIGYSWIAEGEGVYTLHAFVHACLNCSGDFGIIRSIEFSVIDVN